MKKLMSRFSVVAVIVILVVTSFTGCGDKKSSSSLEDNKVKNIAITVVYKDKSKKEFKIETEKEFLGQALVDEKLIEGKKGDYGLYITKVDGQEADESAKEWWCITKGGEQVNTGVDTTPIENGDKFELTLKVWS